MWIQKEIDLEPRSRGFHIITDEVLCQFTENEPYYKHTLEGPDDLPAHLKASILGSVGPYPLHSHQ
nr:YjbQ family protein [Leucothrix mucor]